LLEAADRSVYMAKRQGRNRLVTYDPKDLPAATRQSDVREFARASR
jgi:hypothetical protein